MLPPEKHDVNVVAQQRHLAEQVDGIPEYTPRRIPEVGGLLVVRTPVLCNS